MGKLQVLEMCVARDNEYSLSWHCHAFKLYKVIFHVFFALALPMLSVAL